MVIQANGSLDLNTNIITNDQIKVGSSSDFAIRGRLFSQELEMQIQKKESSSNQMLAVVDKLDFNKEMQGGTVEMQIPDILFQHYDPQVIALNQDETTQQSTWIVPAVILLGSTVVFLGTVLGRLWSKRRYRRND